MALQTDQLPAVLSAVGDHPALGTWRWLPVELTDEGLRLAVGEAIRNAPTLRPQFHMIMVALEEARGNIARHAMDPAGGVCAVRQTDTCPRRLEFLFADDGPGFTIEGARAPYPDTMHGRTFLFRRTLDGTVHCSVKDEHALEIHFEPDPHRTREIALEDLPTNGMGLAIICKVMSSVEYFHGVGPGNILWLSVNIPEN